MPLSLLPSLLLSIIAVGYSPGPANLYSLSCSLRYGRIKSMRMWIGLLCGFSTMAIIASTSVHFAGMALGRYIIYVRYIGAAYLIYLAWKIFHSAIIDESESDADVTDSSCSFLSGFIVQMTNAKMIIYELTIYSTFVLPYSNRLIDLYKVAAWLLLSGPVANLVWLIAGSALKPLFLKHQRLVNTIMAGAILLCAILVVLWSPPTL